MDLSSDNPWIYLTLLCLSRRLTFEEKAELYKVRPDLEVGPTPFFKEQMREMEQRNQRRTLCAIVGGVLCILFLMVVYYLLSFAEGN